MSVFLLTYKPFSWHSNPKLLTLPEQVKHRCFLRRRLQRAQSHRTNLLGFLLLLQSIHFWCLRRNFKLKAVTNWHSFPVEDYVGRLWSRQSAGAPQTAVLCNVWVCELKKRWLVIKTVVSTIGVLKFWVKQWTTFLVSFLFFYPVPTTWRTM